MHFRPKLKTMLMPLSKGAIRIYLPVLESMFCLSKSLVLHVAYPSISEESP